MLICSQNRKLNSVIQKDTKQSLRIDEVCDTLTLSKYFAMLELAIRVYQVKVQPEEREITAFFTPFRHSI